MADGQVVEYGTTEAMFNHPHREATRAFFFWLNVVDNVLSKLVEWLIAYIG
ncbi:hypothetical protein [Desulfoscipio gibsoniae]|uniref:hypothetical protein n=1 Tax=Desulfoscipio gibsoniae TaxID=102134 RepID=UPI0002EE9A7C|nr:hypothetical protein [Desulfoscipio gibsoniae]